MINTENTSSVVHEYRQRTSLWFFPDLNHLATQTEHLLEDRSCAILTGIHHVYTARAKPAALLHNVCNMYVYSTIFNCTISIKFA